MNYDEKAHMGTGYHVDEYQPLSTVQRREEDVNVQAMRTKIPYSTEVYTDKELNEVLDRFEKYNRIVIRSWDLFERKGIDGTILRLEEHQHKTRLNRSPDFRFDLHTYNKSRYLASNMDRLKEELMATLALSKIDDVKIFAGATDSRSIQLVVFKLNDLIGGWLGIMDQIFVPLTNTWYTQTNGQYPYMDMEQKLGPMYDIAKAIQKQRSI